MTPMRLLVHLGDSPDALVRVLMILRRRRCGVTSVDFAQADRHYPGRLVVSILAPPAHAHCVPDWLGKLVDVEMVQS